MPDGIGESYHRSAPIGTSISHESVPVYHMNRYPKDVEFKCFSESNYYFCIKVLQVLVSSNAFQFVLENLLGVLLDKMQEKLNDMMRRDDELERMRR